MSDEVITTRVTSASIGHPGRAFNSARTNHFIVDSPTLGESLSSGEAFLAGVSSCGVTLVEGQAQRTGVPLKGLRVTIEGIRAADRPMNFQGVTMRFELSGVTQAQAEALVRAYKDN